MARASGRAVQLSNQVKQRSFLSTLLRADIKAVDIDPEPWYNPFASNMSPPTHAQRRRAQRYYLPASLMRAGTSKGLFIHQKNLPPAREDWTPWILAAMGSKNNDQRQIDGVGGATSTTSKVAVVSPSSRPGIDVEYTFIQVAVGKECLDFSGNCGNIASGIGPFAVEEGLVETQSGQSHVDISIYNTNTGKQLVETVELDEEGHYVDDGDYMMPGVATPGSEVKVAFIKPAGSMTGQLFPTGERSEQLAVSAPRHGVLPFEVRASFVDAANPFVIVDLATMPRGLTATSDHYLDLVEDVRRAGAVRMGLAKDVQAASQVKGTPKMAFVSAAKQPEAGEPQADVLVTAMSMQKPHPSLQLTGAVCLGAAACIPGTVVHDILSRGRYLTDLLTPEGSISPGQGSEGEDGKSATSLEFHGEDLTQLVKRKNVRLAHSSGQIEVDVVLQSHLDGDVDVESCSVSRTARKIFDGRVIVSL